MTDVLHFLLVPDKAAARRVRRAIASRDACAGTVVGTWGELVDQARRAYLLPPVDAPAAERARKVPEAVCFSVYRPFAVVYAEFLTMLS